MKILQTKNSNGQNMTWDDFALGDDEVEFLLKVSVTNTSQSEGKLGCFQKSQFSAFPDLNLFYFLNKSQSRWAF